jgi:hypothetical protein
VAVDRGSTDAKLGGDLRDRIPALCRSGRLVVHVARKLDLPGAGLRLLPARATARPRSASPSIVRSDISAYSNSAIAPMIWKNSRPDRDGGIDPLVEHDQVDVSLLQFAGELDQMLQGAAEPIQLRHHDLIASAVGGQQRFL